MGGALTIADPTATQLPLIFNGSFKMGNADLSKYSKAIVYFGIDASQNSQDAYKALASKNLIITSSSVAQDATPASGSIVASGQYDMPALNASWTLVTCEIDLTNVNYSGNLYLYPQTPGGTFMLFHSMVLIP